MTYDQRCYDLAEAFLEDHPKINDETRRQDLAQDIQDEVEAFISAELAILEIAKRAMKKKPVDPNIIYPGKDPDFTFPEEKE